METGGGYGGAGWSEVGRGEAEGVPMVLERVTRVGVRWQAEGYPWAC